MSLAIILRTAAPTATAQNIERYEPLLSWLMPRYGINTLLRQRHFLAQILHESGAFRWVREIASGAAYEGRRDLGNTQPGDGVRFRGRGLIQVTGRTNYTAVSRALFGDDRLLTTPEILETPFYATESACLWWRDNGVNAIADRDDVVAVTRRVNGGINGLAERQRFHDALKTFLV